MAESTIDICNIALGWLGANPIMTFDDGITESDLCKSNYPTSKNSVLEMVDWTFARGRKLLYPVAEEVVGTDFSNCFLLDKEMLVVRWISADGSFEDSPKWSLEGRKLYANYEQLYVKYTKRVDDPLLFPAKFDHLVATQLAADICITLTANTKRELALRQKVELLSDQASGADGVQSLPQRQKATRVLGARFSAIGTRGGGLSWNE